MPKPALRHAGYLTPIYNPKQFRIAVKKMTAWVKKNMALLDIDAIAFRGSSGSAVGFPVACNLGLPILYVRKPNETDHSGQEVEAHEGKRISKYIIIDDFISTGTTVNEIVKALDKYDAMCVGIALYNNAGSKRSHKGIPVITVSDFN